MQISKTETYIHLSPVYYNISGVGTVLLTLMLHVVCKQCTKMMLHMRVVLLLVYGYITLLYDIFTKTVLSVAYILDKLPPFSINFST